MKHDRIVIIDEFLVTQMNHWTLFPVVLTVMGLMQPFTKTRTPDVFLWILCSFLPFLFFLVREKADHFSLFFTLHLLLAGLSFFLPAQNMVGKVLAVASGTGYMIHSLSLRFSARSNGYDTCFPPVISILLSAAALFLQQYQGNVSWDFYYMTSLVFVLGIYFIIYYLDKYLDFLTLNASSTGYLPEQEMFRSGLGMVLFYTFMGVLLLFAAANVEWLASLLRAFKNFVRQVIRFLVSLFPEGQAEERIPIRGEPIQEGAMELPEPGESFWLWDVLTAIATVAVLIFLSIMLFKAVKRLIHYLREHFSGSRAKGSAKNGVVFDVHEKCDMIPSVKKRGAAVFHFPGTRERIRKMYKKRVLADRELLQPASDVERLGCLTAREYATRRAIPALADIYEKTRYSGEDPDAEDVRKMKEACRSTGN